MMNMIKRFSYLMSYIVKLFCSKILGFEYCHYTEKQELLYKTFTSSIENII